MDKYSTDQLRSMSAKINAEISMLMRVLNTEEHMKRLTTLRQTRIMIDNEIGMRECNKFMTA